MTSPPVRFVTARDGTQLAYAVYGNGPPLVWAAHWLTHLEFAWESPVWRHMVEFFARNFTVIRYDERGCGLSDWTDRGFDLDTWVGDLGVVVDALGIEQFDLLGISQGGPIAIEYAVRHAERVRRLVLVGSFASGTFISREQRAALVQLIENGWGQSNPAFRQLFTSLFIPDATEEQRSWFNELQRKSTSPQIAAQLFRSFEALDVTARLPHVRQPTLVLHSRGDAAIPFSCGRTLAAGIPHARLVPLADDNHLTLATSASWEVFCREVAKFAGVDDRSRQAIAEASPAVPSAGGAYRFGRYMLDRRSRELRRDRDIVPIEHRVFDMLLYLVEHRDRAVSKDELQEAVWPRMILTESALTRCVMKARRAVGDDSERQAVIRTIHGHGYRFVAPLTTAVPA
jgi:pimeloyl-ACP methyl ester carboxylesterase/DNA-binding winged helix-turn-helix (wHTH) protein